MPIRVLLLFSASACFLCLSGCRLNEAVYHPDGSRIDWNRPPLLKVVEDLDKRHLSVETVCARLNVTLIDTDKEKEFELLGVYMGDKQGNMRLRITGPQGHLVLDMSSHDDGKVDVSLPRKDRYFQGNRDDLLTSHCQLSLLAHAGAARDLFFPRAWTANAAERRGSVERGRDWVCVQAAGARCLRRVLMARDEPLVESMQVFDGAGREVGTIHYGDYRHPDASAPVSPLPKGSSAVNAALKPTVAYPGSLVLEAPGGRHKIEMRVTELHLNAAICDDKFRVPPPEHVKVTDLAAALKRNSSLWE